MTTTRWKDTFADTRSTDLAEAATHINSAIRDLTTEGVPDLSQAHLCCAAPIIRNARKAIQSAMAGRPARVDDLDLADDVDPIDLLWRAHCAVGHAMLDASPQYFKAKFLRVAEAALRTYWRIAQDPA